MKSTGEVMGIDKDFPIAFAKSQIASGLVLPRKGNIFISVKDSDKMTIIEICKRFVSLGFNLISTSGTAKLMIKNKIPVDITNKITEGKPNILDLMLSDEIHLIINTIEGRISTKDSIELRQNAILNNIPYYSTLAEAKAVSYSMEKLNSSELDIKSIQSYINS